MFFFVDVTTPHRHSEPCPPDKVLTSEQIRLTNSDTGMVFTVFTQLSCSETGKVPANYVDHVWMHDEPIRHL